MQLFVGSIWPLLRLIIIDPGIGCWYFQVNEHVWLVGYHLLLILHFWLLHVAPVCQHPSFLLLMPKTISLFCFVDSNWYFIFDISLPCLHHVTSSFRYMLIFSNPNIDMMSVIHPYPLIPICPCQVKCLRGAFHPWAKRQSAAAPEVLPFKDLRIDFPAWGPHGAR